MNGQFSLLELSRTLNVASSLRARETTLNTTAAVFLLYRPEM